MYNKIKINVVEWMYTAGHGWGIFCDLDLNLNVLQSWYVFTYSVEFQTLLYVDRKKKSSSLIRTFIL